VVRVLLLLLVQVLMQLQTQVMAAPVVAMGV
jgi:hypothetical protein